MCAHVVAVVITRNDIASALAIGLIINDVSKTKEILMKMTTKNARADLHNATALTCDRLSVENNRVAKPTNDNHR